MRVLIVDDESPARDRLRRMIEQIDGVEVAAEAVDGREALEKVQASNIEVVLMDIRMPGMDGIEAARHMSKLATPPAVIFTTAYGDHALEAFEAQALDYLLKPVRKERLEKALERARQLTALQLEALSERHPKTRSHLSTQNHGNLQLIPLDEVLYFAADNKYVTAHLLNGREALLDETLKALEEEFPQLFTRIHRSVLVSQAALTGMHKTADGTCRACLKGTDIQPEISRRHVSAVRRLLKERA